MQFSNYILEVSLSFKILRIYFLLFYWSFYSADFANEPKDAKLPWAVYKIIKITQSKLNCHKIKRFCGKYSNKNS